MPIDYATARGQVRLLISDVNEAAFLLSDGQVDAFLSMEGQGVKRAAAAALDTIASSEALLQGRIKLLDLSTDGPAVAKSLREHAEVLRTQADADETDGAFDVVELVYGPFSARERIYNQALRGEL